MQPIRPDIVGNSPALGGYFGTASIIPSIAVEFDTFKHQFDPDSNHVGIDVGGNVYRPAGMPTVYVPARFDNGNVWDAWVDYDGHTLEVRASDSGLYPAAPLLSYQVDIPGILETGSAYLGFGASDAVAYGNHDILSWQYTSVPEPSTLALLGIGTLALGIGWWRKRRAV